MLKKLMFGYTTRKMQLGWQVKHGDFKATYIIISLIVIAIPFISTYTLVTFYLNERLLNYTPQWSDEVVYWHQVATFREEGFHGGYYSINEQPAPFSFIHYYVHGPAYPILFGIVAKLVGWKLYYAPFLNILLLTLALAWFILATRPGYSQLLMIGLTLLTFWPTQLFMATNMRVGLFSAAAVVMALFFYKIIQAPDSVSRFNLVLFFLLIGLMALFQISWALLFIPYMFLLRERLRMSVGMACVVSIVLLVISYVVFDLIVAPYPLYFTSQLLGTIQASPSKGLIFFFQHAFENTCNFFGPGQDSLWLVLRVQLLLLITGCGFLLWRQLNDRAAVRESVMVLTNCGLLLIETVLLFDILHWRDYRLFGPIVLMAVLVLIARKKMWFSVGLVIINLLFTGQFLADYKAMLTSAFPDNRTAIRQFSEEIAPFVQFDKTAGGWENTLLTSPEIAGHQLLLGVLPGIGLSWFTSPDELPTIKSRYLLLDKKDYEALHERTCLEYKLTTDIGDLYVNLGNQCNK